MGMAFTSNKKIGSFSRAKHVGSCWKYLVGRCRGMYACKEVMHGFNLSFKSIFFQ